MMMQMTLDAQCDGVAGDRLCRACGQDVHKL